MRSVHGAGKRVEHAGFVTYRLRSGYLNTDCGAVEDGRLREVRADFARRYVHFLGIDEWVDKWCRANRELATRIGLLDLSRTRPRHRT